MATPAAPPARQFPFFEQSPVKDAQDLASSPEIFKLPTEIVVIASSTVGILVADIHGSIRLVDRKLEATRSWVAHVGGRVTHMVERRGVLVTLGEEDGVKGPLLKIWDLGHTDKKTGAPVLLRSIKVASGSRNHPVSTVALSSTLSHLAIGLGDGAVLLYRNLDQSLFSGSTSLTSLPRPRTVHEGNPSEPITGLGFHEPQMPSSPNPNAAKPESGQANGAPAGNMHLFIVTPVHVLSYTVSGKGSGGAPIEVDEMGCGLGCAVMDKEANNMVIARDEAIYLCSPEGRRDAYVYEGPKSFVQSHRSYLIIVSPPLQSSIPVRSFVSRAASDAQSSDISKVAIIDLKHKYLAYTGTFQEGVKDVVCQWGNVFVLCNDGKLFRLDEKPTTAKLDILYQRSLFGLAISLAQTLGVDEAGIADIYKRSGDHLYSRGDYDGAMGQFIKTLGYLQPSYVIRKFLDAQRIHNLTTYLQELHSRGLAKADHTTLLLNTYTKLKDVSRLDAFIKAEAHRPSAHAADGADKDDLPFDLDTAIRVCRQAGYYEHAAYLARKYERHEDYLRIQIEDAGKYKDALAYLRRLGPEATEHNIARYGRALLANLPDETTQLLIELCTGADHIEEPAADSPVAATSPQAGASYLSYLTDNRPVQITGQLLNMPAQLTGQLLTGQMWTNLNTAQASAPAVTVSTAETHLRAPSAPQATMSRPPSPPPATLVTQKVEEKRPSPRLYFAHFVDHPDQFVRFLEAVAMFRWGQSVESRTGHASAREPLALNEQESSDCTAVWNTLLELYLSQSTSLESSNPSASSALRQKALTLLAQETVLPYDSTHALMICSTSQFTEGLVALWERMGAYEDILRFYIEKENSGETDGQGGTQPPSFRVLYHLNKYGPSNPHLYPLVLRFLTSSPELLSRHTADLSKVLEHIDREKIMPPLGVVQVLSRNGVASVGIIKQWLMTRIAESRGEIEADRHLIDSYRKETREKEQEIRELSDPDHPRVFHVTRCSACGHQLDLPAVHFMCKHSYHQRCLNDQDMECPNCARAHGVIKEIRRNNVRLADQHDLFLAEVDEGGFSAVAAAFGRGLMGRAEETPVSG